MKFLIFISFFSLSCLALSSSNRELVNEIASAKKVKDQVKAIEALRTKAVSFREHTEVMRAGALSVLVKKFLQSKNKRVQDEAFASLYTHGMHSSKSCEEMFDLKVIPAVLQRLNSDKRNYTKQIGVLKFLALFSETTYEIRFFIYSRFFNSLAKFCHFPHSQCSVGSLFYKRMYYTLFLFSRYLKHDDNLYLLLRDQKFYLLLEEILRRKPSEEIVILAQNLNDKITPDCPEPIKEPHKSKSCAIL